MRRPSRTGLSWVFALCANLPLIAQNLESIGREKPFSVSGGFSLNQILYSSQGVAARRDPYSYFASANVNVSVYGWSIPLSFSISNRNTSFTQPFNQYAIHPSWKWVTAHMGYTSASFSPYTVNGHIFAGVAVELEPGEKWKVSALHGRFQRAVEADLTPTSSHTPAFQRTGYAVKATYGDGRNFLDVILFHADDDASSITRPPDSLQVTPQENLAVSIGGGKTLFRHFILKTEFAASAITKDTRAAKSAHKNLLAQSPFPFQPRLSSAYTHATKTSFDYQREQWTFGAGYERIDPGYRTLGAYYFNNDLQNITVRGSGSLLKEKVNLALNAGIQRDNVDKTKMRTMQRIVNSLNITYAPSPKLNVSASWSTFQTYTNIRPALEHLSQLTPYDNLDTLNFTQISRNASISGTYLLSGSEDRRQNITLNLTWQEAADSQGQQASALSTRFYNLHAGYSLSLTPKNMGVAVSFNAAIQDSPSAKSRVVGPTASLSRTFLHRKLRATMSASFTNTRSGGVNIHRLLSTRLNGALSVRDKHQVTASAVLVKRSDASALRGPVTEFTATIGYQYTFAMKGK